MTQSLMLLDSKAERIPNSLTTCSTLALPFCGSSLTPDKNMSRPTPVIVPSCAHHIRERGIRKNPIFYDDSDRLVYLRVLREACREYSVAICAYCLMTLSGHGKTGH